MDNKQLAGLNQASLKKKNDALVRTEKAITKLINKQQQITIRSVAREANVSVSYIYKYPELAYKIQRLREQQKYNHVQPEVPSSKSHQIIATQLRNRINVVEQEKEELTRETKILAANVYEMSKSENSIERLKAQNIELLAENKELRKQLRFFENQISDLRDFILKQGYKKKFDDIDNNKKETKKLENFYLTKEK
ncbi:MAG: hypothetical protein KME09_17890 [Pleurocapsa minor HA4230-MV1]|jgi:predicted RNase H-like nuclease (RuvC/YqgF family)|nr:hypothetical protein [Pleurocapsa minor HA4230-MV1]